MNDKMSSDPKFPLLPVSFQLITHYDSPGSLLNWIIGYACLAFIYFLSLVTLISQSDDQLCKALT